jgi:Conserved TM helix
MTLDDFDVAGILTRVAAAVVILIVTWLIAKLIKTLLSKSLERVKVLQREDSSGQSLGESLATIASLVVWLFGLIAILNLFALTEVVAPIQDLLQRVLAALPGIAGAAIIFFIGLVLARIVRQLVETSLRTAGADNWLGRTDEPAATSPGTTGTRAATTTTTPPLSRIVGQLVFALILIVVSISALQVLGIEAIAEPATQMLTLILNAIPSVIAAALLLGIGYLISRFVAPLLESTLQGLGTDRVLADLGAGGTTGTPPSRVIARAVQVAIVLFFAVAATRVLGFPEVTRILDTVLEVAGGILLGVAIIAVGVFIANLAPRFVSGRAGQILRYATIALFVAIGLGSMGLADSIVNLAFGAIVVGGAAAAALAFGLGGREAAARQLQRLEARAEIEGGSSAGRTTS